MMRTTLGLVFVQVILLQTLCLHRQDVVSLNVENIKISFLSC